MNALQRLIDANAIKRLSDRDPLLFSDDVDTRQPIMQRLGWTDLAEKAAARLPLVTNLATTLVAEGATDLVLLGMGGSSLSALVLHEIIGSGEGYPRLHVLDTTSPVMVQQLMDQLEPAGTYFLLSSKSGTTIEPLSLYAIFREWMDEALEHIPAGKHFIAVTDPGSPLETLRQRQTMRVALSAPPTVGGRFSALSTFGLVPAAILGIDVEQLAHIAHEMEQSCHKPAEENPAAELAAWIADAHATGRDKLTLVASERYQSFGLWVEQLIAESTGKAGIGVVPVIEYASTPSGYGSDRAVVILRDASDTHLEHLAKEMRAEHPVMEYTLDGPLAIGAEFVRWQFTAALLGHLLGINPFDEPNVAEAKKITSDVLAGTAAVPAANADLEGIWTTYTGALAETAAPTTLDEALTPLVAATRPGDYITILAYLPYGGRGVAALRESAARLSSATGNAVCLEMGPRYLHSTGQLHKGGPDTGVFLLLTSRERVDLAVPGKDFSLAQLYRAQAEGDLIALAAHDRRVMRLDLPGDDPAAVGSVARTLGSVAG